MEAAQAGTTKLSTLVKQALKALLYSSVFISCCAFALTIETYLLAGLAPSWPMAVFVFLATLFTYNLSSVQSMMRRPQQLVHKQSKSWALRHKRSMAVLGTVSIAAAAGVYVAYALRISSWLILHLAIISVGYTVPILYRKNQQRALRSVPLLKVFLIAYVWATVTALIPLLDAGLEVGRPEALLLFARRFLFILALALLFDIRDYAYDRQTNTLTFPGLIGVRNTRLLSLGLLAVYAGLLWSSEESSLLLVLLLSAVATAGVVLFSSEKKPRLYYLLLVDGMLLLHAALVYLATQ